MGSISKILADNVATFRKARNFSQEFLAEKADISAHAVWQIEAERTWPEIGTVRKLAEALSIPEERLFQPPATQLVAPTVQEALDVLARAHGFEIRAPKRRHRAKGLKNS